jgi:predicted phosphodiesterase
MKDESDLQDMEFADELEAEPEYSATLVQDGPALTGQFNGEVRDADSLMQLLGLNPKHYYVKKGHAGTWGNGADGQKFSTKAEFELREYDFFADVDRDAVLTELLEKAPHWPDVQIPPETPGRLLEIMVSDLHADKLAKGYNITEARDRFQTAVMSIWRDATEGGTRLPERTILILNGDTFNWDHHGATTKGTVQDNSISDGALVFGYIREMIVGVAAVIGEYCPVEILVMRGNHDYEKAAYLADTLHAWFHNHPTVSCHLMPNDREYIEWGVNLIGITHGDDVKPKDLPMIMMREADAQNRHVFEWHMGHIHTSRLEEYQGVQLRWFRTPSETGPWGQKKGFGLNQKEIVGIVWDDKHGKVAEFPYQFLNG